MLKAAGVNPSSVHYVVIPFPDMITALKAHRVDAISAVEPFVDRGEGRGRAEVLSECQGPTASFPLSGYFATSTWVQSHPNTARAFQQALEKGQAYADANPLRSGASSRPTPRSPRPRRPSSRWSPTRARWTRRPCSASSRMMVSGGLMTKPLDVNSLLLG